MEKSIENHKSPSGLRLPAKATIYYTLTSTLAKAIGVLTTPVFTRILTSESYGKYTFYMSILGLCTLVCSSAISPGVLYRGLDKFRDRRRELIFSAFLCSLLFAGGLSLLLIIFSGSFNLSAELTSVLCLQLLCDSVIGLYQTVRRYDYNYKALSKVNAVSVLLTPLIAVILISGGASYRGRIYALLIVSLAVTSVHLSKLMRMGKKCFDKSLAKYIFSRTLPLLPSSLGTSAGAELDKFMIAAFLGTGALAKYSVAHTLGLGAGFAVSAVSASLYPWVIRKLSSKETAAAMPVFRSILMAVGALGIVISAMLPELFALLAPSEYSEALTGALPLIVSTLPSFATGFITIGIVHADRSGYTFFSAFVSLICGVIFNIILIPKFQYTGAGISLLLSSLMGLFVNYIFLKKCKNEKIFSPEVFIKVLLITSAGITLSYLFTDALSLRILLLIMPVTMLLYAYSGIRELIAES